MVRIIIKGGVWKNTEDEVLKAAIAKYGKNQWARISSLLVRKTPKQCKARWYEWLDPSIKKTEWSKTEDEKLLHLAKLMPTQWRTIAPIVGRTATQCLERYQKLLDEAEAKDNEELGLTGPDGDAGPSADDVRRLRPGEIDPDPETKPARPDPIDMDEDEKEMLSEARARLANTQGKKAKRKARERQLEEARRLAVLQKKRELKAAGIIMRHKTKKKGMDYNADIPFEKKPAAGFYDTAEEQARVAAAPVGQTLRRLENKRKPEVEEAERKKRQRKNNESGSSEHQTKFLPARDAQIQKLKEAESIGRRRKLMLPPAQVGENELESIVKIGVAGENAKALVAGGAGGEASGRLLSDYEDGGLESARMARTPRVGVKEDNILSEARNLRNMTMAQTPLLGEENTPLHENASGGTGFESATPRHQVAFTPNPLATPLRAGGANDVLATPREMSVAGTPLRTPMRDSLSINPDGFASAGDTPREQRLASNSAKRALQAGFLNLPKPENNFELLIPDEEENDADQNDMGLSVEDAEERDARIRKAMEEEEKRVLARRTQVVKFGLPRPANADAATLLGQLSIYDDDDDADGLKPARKLVDKELASLIEYDSLEYPIPGTSKPAGTKSSYEIPNDEAIREAKQLVHRELAALVGFPHANEAQVREGLVAVVKAEEETVRGCESLSWAKMREQMVYDTERKMWVGRSELGEEELKRGWASLLEEYQGVMGIEAGKVGKGEKKLGKVLGGYQARSQVLSKKLVDAWAELKDTHGNLDSFRYLKGNEEAVGPRRVSALKDEVEGLERRERMLQERYKELEAEKREVEERVGVLEEKVLLEAEMLNDASLMEAEV